MSWIYLSPHFDDVALSCGGLVWEQVQAGEMVRIWTICGGKPDPTSQAFSPFAQSLHERWGTGPAAVDARRAEDIAACRVMGAAYRHLPALDCIYRTGIEGQHFYASEEALTGPLHPDEVAQAIHISQLKTERLPRGAQVVCPLSLGNHVDHQLTRQAAEQTGRPLWYYADYPYVLKQRSRLEELVKLGWQRQLFPISAAGLAAWQGAVSSHASQISTFWRDASDMRRAIAEYVTEAGGVYLWKRES